MRKEWLDEIEKKKRFVLGLADVYCNWSCFDIKSIELKVYKKKEANSDGRYHIEEFVMLTWDNGAISTANNNANSLSATARNIARMLDGGVYENLEYYEEIMESPDWIEI